ncbi:MAG: hypothetical protein M9921_13165 [Fimbriimonadaceae bacterium]|nr:hypothetical protein [Fimbriimonadaceae bacterium]
MQWSSGSGGNDHWYQVALITGDDSSWSAARAQAQALGSGSDLATLTSAAENSFVFDLANHAEFWAIDAAGAHQGPYLGGFQTPGSNEPDGGWEWVTGEAWSYTNWSPGEPNNFGGQENVLQLYGLHGREAVWNDVGDGDGGPQLSYVAEMASAPVPEPATMGLVACALALARSRRRT